MVPGSFPALGLVPSRDHVRPHGQTETDGPRPGQLLHSAVLSLGVQTSLPPSGPRQRPEQEQQQQQEPPPPRRSSRSATWHPPSRRNKGEYRLLVAVQPLRHLLLRAAYTTPHLLARPDPHNHHIAVLSYCCLVPLGRSPARSLIIIIMDDPPPPAKRQKTTTAAANEKEPASLDEERKEATAEDDRTIVDLLQSLPANVVANHVYPFAVKVIKNHKGLIEAVDEYLDEYYSDDAEEEKNDNEDVGNNRIRYPIGDWDVSGVDDFTSAFDWRRNRKTRNFNEDLSRWNVASGTWFYGMFYHCTSFNSDLSNWDTGRAINLRQMFDRCTSFNSDLSRWDVGSATNLRHMFTCCTSFNSDLSRWNVANAFDFESMFYGCQSFNSDLSRWNMDNADDLTGMFFDCTSFNSDLSRWNVMNATILNYMFNGCTCFNSDLSQWEVTNAGEMSSMFYGCDSFDRTFVATWTLPDGYSVEDLFSPYED
jgi:surface protein